MTLEKLKLKMQIYKLQEEEIIEKYKKKEIDKFLKTTEKEKDNIINEKDCIKYANKFIYNCSLCNKVQFNETTSSKKWKENDKVCLTCWNGFKEERDDIWKTIREKTGQNICTLCNKSSPIDMHHYDHISCFNKTESIMDMVYRGENIENIMEEVNKCQLLCISCHSMITKFEHEYRLIYKKKKINNLFNKDDRIEQYLIHKERYEKDMNIIYDVIKKLTL